MARDRVTVTLTWSELGMLRAVVKFDIERIERLIELGALDPTDFVGGLKRVKVKLDRPVERLLKARDGI